MQSGNQVLDIGSGNGLQIGSLIQRGVLAVGCDISPALLAVAKSSLVSHGIATPMLQWNGFQMPFTECAFDRVTTNTVLQHVVVDDAVNSIFSETARILKKGGLFLMCELISTKDVQTAPHVKLRSPQTYMQIATQHGLRLKRIRHVVSTYVAIQAVYGRFLARTGAARTRQTTYDVKDDPERNRSTGVLTKRVMRQLVSGFCQASRPRNRFPPD
jgi:ubiquinone/menaquinone biosynthesis C-methylase UbiE